MENNNGGILILGLIIGSIIGAFVSLIHFDDKPTSIVNTNICKEDSLRRVISDLQIEIENEEDGWDKKEKRYEQTLFEYEMGLEHLKHYHLTAYKEFHRIIGYKENYSHEVERENKKRLKNGNTVDLWR
jgi:gas vesicle protein